MKHEGLFPAVPEEAYGEVSHLFQEQSRQADVHFPDSLASSATPCASGLSLRPSESAHYLTEGSAELSSVQ
jgi:hypothetical protein